MDRATINDQFQNSNPTVNQVYEEKANKILEWLVDAPLFIDNDLVERFYDAVLKPEHIAGKTILETLEEESDRRKESGEVQVGAKASLGKIFEIVSSLFPSIEVTGSIKEGQEDEKIEKNQNRSVKELIPIINPERQLVHLTLYYLLRHPERITFVDKPYEELWRRSDNILKTPRQLVFLDLPGNDDIDQNLCQVKLIPMASEFTSGKVVRLHDKLLKENGERPPSYPEIGKISITKENLKEKKIEYWRWFDDNFRAKKAMEVVEDAAFEHGKIQWIDYRLPIAIDGSTLHLHIRTAGKYDTGVTAYRLIKRGASHGLRIVGTLKSEPAINVLAIFEK